MEVIIIVVVILVVYFYVKNNKSQSEPTTTTVKFKVAGLYYRDYDTRRKAASIEPFNPIFFERQPDNEYDRNAVKVKMDPYTFIGYVPKEYSFIFAKNIDNIVDASCVEVNHDDDNDVPDIIVEVVFKGRVLKGLIR